MESLIHRLRMLENIGNAYESWADYRAALTAFICKNTERGSSVSIYGAGRCGDLELTALTEHFRQVVLIDRDTASMRAGLCRQGIDEARVTCSYADFVGISDAAYEAVERETAEAIRRGGDDADAVTQAFLSAYGRAFDARKPVWGVTDKTDYAVACGVHSQLLTAPVRMAHVLSRYGALDLRHVEACVRRQNAAVTRELTDEMLQHARRGIFLGLETGRVGETGGIEGASQALDRVERMRHAIANETELVWPFDGAQGKRYRMRVVKIAQ